MGERGLVLADIPERNRLRELQRQLEERRDQIAELDLEIETLREALWRFESGYRARLADEHHMLARIEGLVQHLGRWADLLRDEPRRVASQGKRIERRRKRELASQRERAASPPEDAELASRAAPAAKDERLKSAYRALARRFHPDLARTEEERLRHSEVMARINALYRAGDLGRLLALAEQAKGGEVDEPELDVTQQLEHLEARLRWFDAVLDNLRDERAGLERTPTCQLWRNVEQAAAAGRDLILELKQELQARVQRAYDYVRKAAYELEAEVSRFNRERASLSAERKATAVSTFDPFGDKRLVRLGLDELAAMYVSPAAQRQANAIEQMSAEKPALLRLVLLTYVSELSPFPLPGLETYDDVALRLRHLSKRDAAPLTLEQALVEADTLLEWGVRQANPKVVHTGLRFCSQTAREATTVLLRSLTVRRVFKQVLGVLGEYEKCNGCKKRVFLVPLFRTHGIDDLRALVCPRCGEVARSYWMPRGKDVQAVLNDAFLDFGIVVEFSFRLGRDSIGAQLLPLQVERMTVGALKQRFVQDVLARHEVNVAEEDVQLLQGGHAVADETALDALAEHAFVVRFSQKAAMSESDALELLRHRARTRFRAG